MSSALMIFNTPTPCHLLTLREYAAELKEVLPPLIENFTKRYQDAEAAMKQWYADNPEPVRPLDTASDKAHQSWRDACERYNQSWHSQAHKSHYAYGEYKMVAIILPEMIDAYMATEDGDYPHFDFHRYGGVNNPLIFHGGAVERALRRGLEVPDKVKSEYPKMVKSILEDQKPHFQRKEG